jgi:phage/plasmid-like protein (TIGR03299 family)
MSDNISISQGRAEVFVAGVPAWHNLGINVSKCQTWQQAYKLAHLQWGVSKVQLLNPITAAPIPLWALLRDDTNVFFHAVGSHYLPVQNKQTFEFCDALVESHEAHYESAGALGKGEVVWCLVKLNQKFAPVRGDVHETYLLFVDYRDGHAPKIKITTQRVVCRNTLNLALGEATGTEIVSLRHTSSINAKLALAKGLIKGVSSQINTLNDKFKRLNEVQVTQKSLADVLGRLFPNIDKSVKQQNMAAQIAENFMAPDTQQEQGTMYSLFQGVTRWVDHQRTGFRTSAEDMGFRRAEEALFGTGDEFKSAALDNILSIVDSKTDKAASDRIANILSSVTQ